MSDPRSSASHRFLLPLDRWAIALMLLLSVLIAGLLWRGDHTSPKVRQFNWQNQVVGSHDRAMIFTFSRPMDRTSVEENFHLTPAIPGKFSWAGRRMAYTLTQPLPYGTRFTVEINDAHDRFSRNVDNAGSDPEILQANPLQLSSPGSNSPNSSFSNPDFSNPNSPLPNALELSASKFNVSKANVSKPEPALLQPFKGQFRTRDRAFVYLGVDPEEESALVLYNLTQQEKRVLTPQDLVVVDFEPYPTGDRVLFSATDRTAFSQGDFDPKLYTVTTGIAPGTLGGAFDPSPASPPSSNPQPSYAGEIHQILDSGSYQNLKFDLSPDGNIIIVQRANKTNPGADFGLWILRPGQGPQPLATEPGGEFLITPDSNALVMALGQGLAVLPLESHGEPVDFLPQFGQVLTLSADGRQAAMVRFNGDYTRSLFLVTNQGIQQELWRTDGSILTAEFDPTQQILYALVTRLIPAETYQEEPFLLAIDLPQALQSASDTEINEEAVRPLLRLVNQRDISLSLAPDGLAMLFDQVEDHVEAQGKDPAQNPEESGPRSSEGKVIRTSRLWLLPLVYPPATPNASSERSTPLPQPEPLPIAGLRPHWLP